MLYKKLSLIFFGIFLSFTFLAQNKEFDSLTAAIKVAESDTVKVNLLIKLGTEYRNIPDNSIYSLKKALKISRLNNYEEGIYRTCLILGEKYYEKQFYSLSIKYSEEALGYPKFYKNKIEQVEIPALLGMSYVNIGNIGKAMEYNLQGLDVSEKNNYHVHNLNILNNIGSLYDEIEDYENAMKYYNKSFELSKKVGNKPGVVMYYINTGVVLFKQEKYEEAIQNYNKALELNLGQGNIYDESICLENIADAFSGMKQYNKAEKYYEQALSMSDSINDFYGKASILKGWGGLYFQQRLYNKAIDKFKESIYNAEMIEEVLISVEAYKEISETYSLIGEYNKAFEYFKKYQKLNDSILSAENNIQIARLEAEREDLIIKNENINLKQKLNIEKRFNRILIVSVILFLILFIVLISMYVKYKKSNKKLHLKDKQFNREKNRTKQAEEALILQEEHFKSFIDDSSDFVLYRIKSTDNDDDLGDLLFYSSSASEVLGLENPDDFESWFGKIHEDDFDRVRRANILAGKKVMKFNETFRIFHKKKNKWIWINAISNPVYDKKGGFVFFNGVAIDVTNRKELEKALEESEIKYRDLIENLSDGICVNDEKELFILANKTAEMIFGVKPGNLVGRNLKEFLSQGNSNVITQKTNERLEGKKDDYIIEIIRSDNEKRLLKVKAIPSVNEKNDLRTVAIIRDITEEKFAEQKLIASEFNYRSLFEKNPTSLWEEDYSDIVKLLNEKKAEGVKDMKSYIENNPDFVELCNKKYKVKNINEETLKLLKVQSKEDITNHPHKFFTDSSFMFFKKVLIAFSEGNRSVSGEIVLNDSLGNRVYVQIKLFVFNEYQNVIVSMADVTDKKEAQQKVLLSETEFRNLFDNNPVALWEEDYKAIKIILDKKKNEGVQDIKKYIKENRYFSQLIRDHYSIRRVNKETLKFFKVPDEEYLFNNIYRFFTEKSDIVFFELMEAFANDKKVFKKESTYFDNNGKILHLILKVNVITDDYSRVIVSFTDITYRLRIEERLIVAQEKAEESNRLKSQFLANMSHEIRTPLNAIIGFSDILKNQIIDIKHRSFIEKIILSGNNLLSLINDILDLSKIEANELSIIKSETNLENVLKETVEILSEKIKEKEIKFSIHKENEIPERLNLDEVRVKQVLINLLGNAFKFTEKGFVTVTLKTEYKINSKIDLFISIKDTGIGIPDDQIDSIFEIFRQADGHTARKFGGTGLGLSITKNLVEMMGGEISAKSSGSGSEFTFSLKDVDVFDEQTFIEEYDVKYKEKIKMIYADDLEINREVFRMLVEDENIELKEAIDGEEVLELLKEETPDLILLDIQMPKLDGFETAEIIREKEKYNNIPIVALTANVEVADKKRLKAIFDYYIEKPISLDKIKNMILKYFKQN